MRKKHVIQKLSVELHYPSRDMADANQDQLVDQIRKLILSELQKLFDRFSYSDEVITIERLEIDLGEFKPDILFDELSQKLKTELEQVMTKLVYEVRTAFDGKAEVHFSIPGGGIMSVEAALTKSARSSLEKLFYFLFYGVLPWSADTESPRAVKALAEEAIEHELSTFTTALRQSATRTAVFKRLAAQLPEGQVIRLMASLSGEGEERLSQWLSHAYHFLGEWQKLQQQLPSGWNSSGMRFSILSAWLQIFAQKQGTGWTEEEVHTALMEFILSELSAKDEEDLLELLFAWKQVSDKSKATQAYYYPLLFNWLGKNGINGFSKEWLFPGTGSSNSKTGSGSSNEPDSHSGTHDPNKQNGTSNYSRHDSSSNPGKNVSGSAVPVPDPAQLSKARQLAASWESLDNAVKAAVQKRFTSDPAGILVAAAFHETLEKLNDIQQREEALLKIREKQAAKDEEARIKSAEAAAREAASQKDQQDAAKDAAQKAKDQAEAEKRKRNPGKRPEDEVPLLPEEVYIRNAGMVLLWPYLNVFFTRCGLMENKQFLSNDARIKAVYLLQFLVTGEEAETEEHELLLNKIMCGLSLGEALPAAVLLTEEDRTECENLLKLVISRWELISRSSVRTLRDSFLKKEGKLIQDNQNWNLVIPRQQSTDILIDRLPWGIGMIKLAWADYMIYVEW